jgi:D-lyxose ketol-isomerase
MEQGASLMMPSGTAHRFMAVGGASLLLEVSTPSVRGDNLFTDKRIGKNGLM